MNVPSTSERLNILKDQVEHLRLLLTGAHEARVKNSDSLCSGNLLLISSACDSAGALGFLGRQFEHRRRAGQERHERQTVRRHGVASELSNYPRHRPSQVHRRGSCGRTCAALRDLLQLLAARKLSVACVFLDVKAAFASACHGFWLTSGISDLSQHAVGLALTPPRQMP